MEEKDKVGMVNEPWLANENSPCRRRQQLPLINVNNGGM